MKEVKFLDEQEMKMLKLFDKYNLSVSSVKYFRGHDADQMTANLKIGSKIMGTVLDDSWGGGYQYDGDKVKDFLKILDDISKEVGPYYYKDMEMTYDHDSIVYKLIDHTKNKRDCKKKTIIHLTNAPITKDGPKGRVKSFEFRVPYDQLTDDHIMKECAGEEKKGYEYIEIINKRYIA